MLIHLFNRQCWRVIFLLSMIHTLNQCHLSDVRLNARSSNLLSFSSFVWGLCLLILIMILSIFQWGTTIVLFLWWDFARNLGFKKPFRPSVIAFSCFFLFISAWVMSDSKIPKYVPSLLAMLFWFGNSIPNFTSLFPLFNISMSQFSITNYIPIS